MYTSAPSVQSASPMKSVLLPFAMTTLLMGGAFGCSPVAGPISADDAAEIRAGEIDHGDPAVGLLVFEGGTGICTGTLIAADVVVTAGHCVDGGKIPAAFYIGTGAAVAKISGGEATVDMAKYDVAAGEFVPGYVVTTTCPKLGLDVGLVKLAAPVVGIAPVSIASRTPEVRETCEAVGFGKHPLADGTSTRGQKRSAEVTFRSSMHGAYAFDDKTGGTEKGDSGGPLFCAGALTGVNSCGNRPDRFARLALAMPWIEAKVADWNAPWMGGAIGDLGPLPAGANAGE